MIIIYQCHRHKYLQIHTHAHLIIFTYRGTSHEHIYYNNNNNIVIQLHARPCSNGGVPSSDDLSPLQLTSNCFPGRVQ